MPKRIDRLVRREAILEAAARASASSAITWVMLFRPFCVLRYGSP
ncbi:hypothetical protein [Nonomuraea sp. NPDC050643]